MPRTNGVGPATLQARRGSSAPRPRATTTGRMPRPTPAGSAGSAPCTRARPRSIAGRSTVTGRAAGAGAGGPAMDGSWARPIAGSPRPRMPKTTLDGTDGSTTTRHLDAPVASYGAHASTGDRGPAAPPTRPSSPWRKSECGVNAILSPVCRRKSWKGSRVRALRPSHEDDAALLLAIGRGEFLVNGFRNRDLVQILHSTTTRDPQIRRRLASRVTRMIRMLRAHRLVRKVPKTHRYMVTSHGHQVITALAASRDATPRELLDRAA